MAKYCCADVLETSCFVRFRLVGISSPGLAVFNWSKRSLGSSIRPWGSLKEGMTSSKTVCLGGCLPRASGGNETFPKN